MKGITHVLSFLVLLGIAILLPRREGMAQKKDNPNLLLEQHHKIQKIFLSQKFVLRGFDFGVNFADVKAAEKAILIGEGDNFAIYQINLAKNESADIIYYIDRNRKVSGFGISVVVPTRAEEHHLYHDFTKYLNERFGKYSYNAKSNREWTINGEYTIELGESRDGDIYSLELEFTKITKSAQQ